MKFDVNIIQCKITEIESFVDTSTHKKIVSLPIRLIVSMFLIVFFSTVFALDTRACVSEA